jgi:hypothetical protein
LQKLAQELGTSTWALGLVTSSLFVVNCTTDTHIDDDAKIHDYSHWNIGLNMKMRAKNQKLILPGYTRVNENTENDNENYGGWEFSTNAVETIKEYHTRFPFVFEALNKFKVLYNRMNKFFKIFELFSTLEDFDQKLSDIASWINTHEVGKSSFCPAGSHFLSKADCRKIEEYVESRNKSGDKINETMCVNPNYVYQESYPWIPPFLADEPIGFRIGDRVVNIKSTDHHFVPFGLKGTVTAIHESFLEIMFDREYYGGSTCNGRFSGKRGAHVNALGLINLTQ